MELHVAHLHGVGQVMGSILSPNSDIARDVPTATMSLRDINRISRGKALSKTGAINYHF